MCVLTYDPQQIVTVVELNIGTTQLEILRQTHAHHESRHRQMKEEHGNVLEEFEGVVRELDSLSNELHMVSDHAVQLDANFTKYGYSAHLRMFHL